MIRKKKGWSGRHVPIVAMTASALKGDEAQCLKAGMDGYVSKPVLAPQLYAVMGKELVGSSR